MQKFLLLEKWIAEREVDLSASYSGELKEAMARLPGNDSGRPDNRRGAAQRREALKRVKDRYMMRKDKIW